MKTKISGANRDTYRRFPFKGISKFSTDMGEVGERRRAKSYAYGVCVAGVCITYPTTISSVSVCSSGRSKPLPRHRSIRRLRSIPPRMPESVDNLFERRASNVSYLRNRERASARPLRHSGFRAFFVAWPLCGDGVDLFRRYRRSRSSAMFINESQLQSVDRTRIFIQRGKSHVAIVRRRSGSQFRCTRSMKLD